MPTKRGVAAVLAAVGLGFGLLACSNEEPTELTDPGSNSKETSAAPPDTPEPEPTEETSAPSGKGESEGKGETGELGVEHGKVDAATEAEIEAFITGFLEEYNGAWASGDTSALRELFTDACSTCADEMAYLEHIHSDGGSVSGGDYVEPEPRVVGIVPDEKDIIEVHVGVTITAYEIAGPAARTESEERTTEKFNVQETPDGWRVVWWY